MQCRTHIHQSKLDQLTCMAPLGAMEFAKPCLKLRRGKERRRRSGPRGAPGATGRGVCGEVLWPPAVLPLWTDCGHLHSNAAVCAAALPPSTSSPEAFAPPPGAERTHTVITDIQQ